MASMLDNTADLSPGDVAILADLNIRLTSIGLVIDCEGCGNAIVLTLCQTDRNGNAGKPMARHPQCEFFKWFPRLLLHPRLSSLIQPYAPGSSSTSRKSPPSDSTSVVRDKKIRRRGAHCLGPLCRRSAAMRCGKTMCLSHCKVSGGCPFHGVVNNQSETIDLDFDDSGDLTQTLDASDETVTDIQTVTVLPTPMLPPSPPPPSQSSRGGRAGGSSKFTAPFQVADTSKTRPRITRQLDPLWMEDLSKLAAQEVESQKAEERRREMTRIAQRRFIIHWYDADDVPVRRLFASNCPYFPQYQLINDPEIMALLGEDVIQFEVFEPSLRLWITASLDHTFTVESGYHLFLRRFGVSRCANFDQDLQITRDSKRPANIRTNMRSERQATRSKDKARASMQPTSSQVSLDSDSEVEIVEMTYSRVADKRRRSPSLTSRPSGSCPSPFLPNSFKYKVPVKVEPSVHTPSLSSRSPSPSFTLSPTSSSTSDLSQPHVPARLPTITRVLVPDYEGHQVWPQGMYTVDMCSGFRQVSNKQLQACHSPAVLFTLVFGVPFVKPTYYNNLQAWNETSQELLEECEAAGRNPAGLWSYYLSARRQMLGLRSKIKVRKLQH